RPLIQPILTGLLGPRGRTFGLMRSVSATRSNSVSSDTPVEQLQKPIFGRTNKSILTPQSAGMQTKALPMPHWSCKNGHLVSVHPLSPAWGGGGAVETAALGMAGAHTPNTAATPAMTIAAAMPIANGARFMCPPPLP